MNGVVDAAARTLAERFDDSVGTDGLRDVAVVVFEAHVLEERVAKRVVAHRWNTSRTSAASSSSSLTPSRTYARTSLRKRARSSARPFFTS